LTDDIICDINLTVEVVLTKKEKLIDKISNNPKGIRFEDACKLAILYGFEEKGGKGSHRVFTMEGVREIINLQNVKGEAKPYQVRQLLMIIERYGLKEAEK